MEQTTNQDIYVKQPTRPAMTYVKSIEDLKMRNSGPLYTQYFLQDNFAKVPKTPIMELYYKGAVDNDDIRILDYIYETRFTIEDQVERWCQIQGIENGKERLRELSKYGLVNQFFIAIWNKNKSNVIKPKDALLFYCLKPSAKFLLEEYTHRLYVNWEAGDNLTDVKNVENRILLNEIFLDTISVKAKPKSWSFKSEYVIRDFLLRPSFVCTYEKIPKNREYMVYDIIRSDDNIEDIQEKLQKWEEYFVRTKFWTKTFIYTNQLPMLIFVTDDDNSAYALAEHIGLTTKLNVYLITTIDRIRNKALGDVGRFIKYNKEDKTLYEIQYKLFS